jgi:hypothetical protein
MSEILLWIAVVIAIEATVEIEVDSVIFQGFRARLADIRGRLGWYLNGLFSCGYCLSVWVSILGALVIPTTFGCPWIVAFIIKIFVLHRLSNMWHELLKRWFDRIPVVLAFKPEDLSSDQTIEVITDAYERTEEEEENAGTSSDSGRPNPERDGSERDSQEL